MCTYHRLHISVLAQIALLERKHAICTHSRRKCACSQSVLDHTLQSTVFAMGQAWSRDDENRTFTGVSQPKLSVRTVVVPPGIETIGPEAFRNCKQLVSIELPETLTRIERAAFCGCSSLTSLKLPSNITHICDNAFQSCSGLVSVVLPDTVKFIGKQAFQCCSRLTSIALPKGTTLVRPGTFQLCGLKSVTLPDTITSIGKDGFSGCHDLTSITLPNTVTNIGRLAFSKSGLTSFTCPKALTSIGEHAFLNCTFLSAITLSDSLTSIGKEAFAYCNHKRVYTEPRKDHQPEHKGSPFIVTLSKNSKLTDMGIRIFIRTFVQKFILRPPTSRRAFIAWSVGHSRHRSNWQLTTVKHVRNVLRLITSFAILRPREFEAPFPKFEFDSDPKIFRVLNALMVKVSDRW